MAEDACGANGSSAAPGKQRSSRLAVVQPKPKINSQQKSHDRAPTPLYDHSLCPALRQPVFASTLPRPTEAVGDHTK